MPLTDVDKPEVKLAAAELASILYDVLDAVKNAPPAYRQMVEEHKALKTTKAANQSILDDNRKALDTHRTERFAWSAEQQKDKTTREKHIKEMSDREKDLQARETACNVRDVALGRRDAEQKELQKKLDARDTALKAKDEKLAAKEMSVHQREVNVAKGEDTLRAKQDELDRIMKR